MSGIFIKFKVTRTRLIQVGAAAFLIGLLLARYGFGTNLALLIISAAFCPILLKRARLAFVLIAFATLNLGLWRGQVVFRQLQAVRQYYDQKVELRGSVQDDPGPADHYQTEFHITDVKFGVTKLPGRIQIRGFSDFKIKRGDTVQVSGKLRSALGNRQGQISFAQIQVTGQPKSWLEHWRRRFFAGLYTALPEPAASLGLGFLVGARSLLPQNLLDQLGRTGLTHIVAVSGYNLTILIRFTRRLLAKHSKYLTTAASIGLMLGFLAVTGISPSIFRAAIVSGLALAAWYYGRPLKPLLLILLAAAITAGISPSYLWYDIGWYLSFLAFFGVLIVAPAISARIYKTKMPSSLAQLVIESLSAQIMVLPIIVYVFGQVSLVALPANVIVLPLIPFAMLLTFVAGLGGTFAPPLVGWLAWPARIILGFIVNVVQWLASWHWAAAQLGLNNWHLGLLYLSIGILLLAIKHGAKRSAPTKANQRHSIQL